VIHTSDSFPERITSTVHVYSQTPQIPHLSLC